MPLSSTNPISIPAAGNYVAYGVAFYPKANTTTGRLLIFRRQYRCNTDGSGVVWINDELIESHGDIVADAAKDAILSAFWASVSGLAATLGTAKSVPTSAAAPLAFILKPILSATGTVTAALRLYTSATTPVQTYATGDVFTDAQTDAPLAACVVPLETAMGTFAAARGW